LTGRQGRIVSLAFTIEVQPCGTHTSGHINNSVIEFRLWLGINILLGARLHQVIRFIRALEDFPVQSTPSLSVVLLLDAGNVVVDLVYDLVGYPKVAL
jgi:hypothetical protein